MRRRALALAGLATGAAVALGGCGSDAPTPESVPTSSSPPVVATTGTSDGSLDICARIDAGEIGRIVGADVSVAKTGDGCTFTQSDATAETVALTPTPYDKTLGGLVSTKAALASVFDGGTPKDLDGIGDAAFAIIGAARGGSDTQAAGAVQIGSTVVVATIVQGSGVTDDVLRTELTAVLTLVADKR